MLAWFIEKAYLCSTFSETSGRARGVAQLVAHLVWDQVVARSSRVTPTTSTTQKEKTKRKSARQIWGIKKYTLPLQRITKKMVPWMSGLVTGLQNRLRRFESARHLS